MRVNPSENLNDNTEVDTALWARFMSAGYSTDSERTEYLRNWLALQCSLISNVSLGVVVMGNPDTGSYSPMAIWPEDEKGSRRLSEIIERVIEDRRGLVTELPVLNAETTSLPAYGIAYPVMEDEKLHGVVAIEVPGLKQELIHEVMGKLHWGISWLELLVRRQHAVKDKASLERLKTAIDQLAKVLSEEHFDAAAMTFVTELSTYLHCDRVSLGFIQKGRARVQALSHSAQFGKRMNLIRAIGTAMDEAIDQRREILYPPSKEDILITREHEALAEEFDVTTILTIPLYSKGHYYGAVTLERSDERSFTEDEIDLCRSISALTGSSLEDKRQNDKLLIHKISDSLRRQFVRLFGPHYTGRKLAALFLIGLVVFFTVATGDYRISSDTEMEGAVRRVIAAPYEGYVNEAFVRAGDIVKRDEVLTTLDDRDLRLERIKYLSQRTQLQSQYQEAMAKHDRAQVNIFNSQIAQVTAQLELIEGQLQRTSIRAPFDGLIVSGDLSQTLGGAVKQGDVLFEMTPLDAYRIILKVDERRITDVKNGQDGILVLSSIPDEQFPFVVEKITPVTIAEEGLNYFRVEASLTGNSRRIRPGMEGVGKIYVDERKLISIWTRDLVEWFQLWTWSWMP